jgi:hypothetical protein
MQKYAGQDPNYIEFYKKRRLEEDFGLEQLTDFPEKKNEHDRHNSSIY